MAPENIGLEAVLGLSDWDRNVDQYLRDLGKLNSANDGFVAGARKSFQDLGGVILGAATAATTAAVAIGAAAGKAFADWTLDSIGKATDLESQMSDIAAVMNRSRDEIEPLNELINDLAINPNLKIDTFQAADAIAMLARNGLDMEQIMGGAAEATALLANATNDDFAMSADIATDAMVLFNKRADEMTGVVDGIVAVTQASKFSIEDYALFLAQAGGVAGSVGVSFEDFNAIMAATSSSFASGSDAGTSLKTFLQRLVPQSNEAADAMRDLGLFSGLTGKEFDKVQERIQKTEAAIAELDPTSKDYTTKLDKLNRELAEQRAQLVAGGSAFFDSNGNMRSATEIAQALSDAFSGLSDEQRIHAASTIFGTDAMRTALSLVDGGVPKIQEFMAVYAETSGIEAAATRMDNLAGAIEVLGGVIEAIQIGVGQKFQDTLKRWAQALTGVLEGRADQIVEVFGALAEWASEASTRLIPLAEEWLPRVIDNLTALGHWLIEAATTGDVWNEFLQQMDPDLRRWMESLLGVGEAIQLVNQKIGEIIDWIGQAIAPVVEWVASFVDLEDVLIAAGLAVAAFLAPMAVAAAKMAAVGAAATLAVAAIRDAWENNLGGVRDFVGQVWNQIEGIVATGIEIVQVLWSGHGTELSNFATSAWETVKSVITGALNVIQGVLDTVLAAVEGDWTTVWTNISHAATKIWEGVTAAWNATLQTITDYVGDHWPIWQQKLGEWAAVAWEWLTGEGGVVSQVATQLGEWLGALGNWIVANAPGWGETLGEWGAVAWEWLIGENGVVWQVADKLGEWLTALSQWVVDNAPSWAEKLGEFGTAAWEWLVGDGGAIAQVGEKLGEWLEALKSWVVESAPGWADALVEFNNATWEWISDPENGAIAQASRKLGEWLAALVLWANDPANQNILERAFAEWGKLLYEWIDTSGVETTRAMNEWAAKLDGPLGNALQKITNFAAQAALAIQLAGQTMEGDWAGAWETLKEMAGLQSEMTYLNLEGKLGAFGGLFKNAGENAVAGFVEGMTGGQGEATGAVGDFGNAMQEEMRRTLDIRSPSGVFEELALMSVKGFEQGIVDNMRLALAAATDLTTQFLAKFDVIISKLPLVARDSMMEFVRLFESGMGAAVQYAMRAAAEFVSSFLVVGRELPAIAQAASSQYGAGFEAGFQRVLDVTASFGHQMLAAAEGLSQSLQGRFVTAGQQAGQGFIGGLNSTLAAVQAKVTEIGNLAAQALGVSLDAHSPSRVFEERGVWAVEGFIQGVDQTAGDVVLVTEEMVKAMIVLFDYAGTWLVGRGEEVADGLITGIASKISELSDVIGSMIQTVRVLFDQAGSWLYRAGADMVQGFVDGIDSLMGKVTAKVTELGNLAAHALSLSLQIQSPSRVFAEQGEYAAAGLILGLERMLGAVEQAAAGLGANALAGVQTALGSGLGSLLSPRLMAQAAAPGGATMQTYATHNYSSNQFGPVYVNTPMDWAEMEHRMRRIVAESF